MPRGVPGAVKNGKKTECDVIHLAEGLALGDRLEGLSIVLKCKFRVNVDAQTPVLKATSGEVRRPISVWRKRRRAPSWERLLA